MSFDLGGFCAGVATCVIIGFLTDSNPPSLLLMWFLLSFGVVIGAGLFWLSGSVESTGGNDDDRSDGK